MKYDRLLFFKHVLKRLKLERDELVAELSNATGEDILAIYERMSRKSYAEFGSIGENK